MRELLERWAKHEPRRCYEVEYGDGHAHAVEVGGEPFYADSPVLITADPPVQRAFILSATIEAIAQRGWFWELDYLPWDDEPGRHNAKVALPGGPNRYEPSYSGCAGTPAEALLTAYLAALEANHE